MYLTSFYCPNIFYYPQERNEGEGRKEAGNTATIPFKNLSIKDNNNTTQ